MIRIFTEVDRCLNPVTVFSCHVSSSMKMSGQSWTYQFCTAGIMLEILDADPSYVEVW